MRKIWLGLWAVGFLFVADTPATEVVTNLWMKAGGGNWDETGSWSRGELPGSSQWVGILNPSSSVIEINAETAEKNPESLALFHLIVGNTNTLLLNQVGASLRL